MKKIVLILLYLPIALLGQETNYHLLDSNFVEINIANPNKISKKKEEIYTIIQSLVLMKTAN